MMEVLDNPVINCLMVLFILCLTYAIFFSPPKEKPYYPPIVEQCGKYKQEVWAMTHDDATAHLQGTTVAGRSIVASKTKEVDAEGRHKWIVTAE